MRTIKFRAWDRDKKRMCFEVEIDTKQFGVNRYFQELKEHYDIQQFTGLLDENGTEIYEEDIIKLGDRKGIVRWKDCLYRFDGRIMREMDSYEVIGNIYENPELLK